MVLSAFPPDDHSNRRAAASGAFRLGAAEATLSLMPSSRFSRPIPPASARKRLWLQETEVRDSLLGVIVLVAEIPSALLTYALATHGVETVYAAYTETAIPRLGKRYHIWFACDVGLVFCTVSGGADGQLPAAKCDVTSWRDVRDVEVGGEVTQMAGASAQSDFGYVRELRMTIQLPRFNASAHETATARALGKFARHVLLQYAGHR
jgi:hypothetical protein